MVLDSAIYSTVATLSAGCNTTEAIDYVNIMNTKGRQASQKTVHKNTVSERDTEGTDRSASIMHTTMIDC